MNSLIVRADVLLRALAIITVTYNHAHPYSNAPLGWGGGMTFLMMLSGYNFAKFGMNGMTPAQTRNRLLHLGWRIFLPSVVTIAGFFLLLQKFDLAELLFYRNWLTPERISKFPTWYPQVILQMFIGLYVLFSIPIISRTILQWPLQVSAALFLIALLVRRTLPDIWDTTPLHHHLPHLFLWNFILGWLVYFSVNQPPRARGIPLAGGCAFLAATIVYRPDMLDFWWLTIGVLLLALPLDVRLPSALGRFLLLVSQATFTIFLLHRLMYKIYEHLPIPQQEDLMWACGLLASLAVWMGGSALIRAYRAIRRRIMKDASHSPTSATLATNQIAFAGSPNLVDS